MCSVCHTSTAFSLHFNPAAADTFTHLLDSVQCGECLLALEKEDNNQQVAKQRHVVGKKRLFEGVPQAVLCSAVPKIPTKKPKPKRRALRTFPQPYDVHFSSALKEEWLTELDAEKEAAVDAVKIVISDDDVHLTMARGHADILIKSQQLKLHTVEGKSVIVLPESATHGDNEESTIKCNVPETIPTSFRSTRAVRAEVVANGYVFDCTTAAVKRTSEGNHWLHQALLQGGDPPRDKPLAPNTPREFKKGLNEHQKQAVEMVRQHPLVFVQGPPGTGKTTTAVGIIRFFASFSRQIGATLVCAPSNAACDELAIRLHAMGADVLRVVALSRERQPSRLPDSILFHKQLDERISRLPRDDPLRALHEQYRKKSFLKKKKQSRYNRLVLPLKAEILGQYSVLCMTCVEASILDRLPVDLRRRISFVVIDEAGQCSEPEALIPIECNPCGVRRVVLLGDHKQLGPVVKSRETVARFLATSLFHRQVEARRASLLAPPALLQPVLLEAQYRMHPVLAAFPSAYFYGGKLQSMTAKRNAAAAVYPFPRREMPLVFLNYPGNWEQRSLDGISFCNEREAEVVLSLLRMLLADAKMVRPADIGVITFYRGQEDLLVRRAKARYPDLPLTSRTGGQSVNTNVVEISSVDGFQGREKRFIVISCVRSNEEHGIGFLNDDARINVALTRCKQALFVVGSLATLKDPKNAQTAFHAFALHCETNDVVKCV